MREAEREPFGFGPTLCEEICADGRCEEGNAVHLRMEIVDLPGPDAFGNAGQDDEREAVQPEDYRLAKQDVSSRSGWER